MHLTPYATLLSLPPEELQAKTATTQINHQKQRGLLRLAELDEQIANLENSVNQLCSSNMLSFDIIADSIDSLALTNRRREQLQCIINELFPPAL